MSFGDPFLVSWSPIFGAPKNLRGTFGPPKFMSPFQDRFQDTKVDEFPRKVWISRTGMTSPNQTICHIRLIVSFQSADLERPKSIKFVRTENRLIIALNVSISFFFFWVFRLL